MDGAAAAAHARVCVYVCGAGNRRRAITNKARLSATGSVRLQLTGFAVRARSPLFATPCKMCIGRRCPHPCTMRCRAEYIAVCTGIAASVCVSEWVCMCLLSPIQMDGLIDSPLGAAAAAAVAASEIQYATPAADQICQ